MKIFLLLPFFLGCVSFGESFFEPPQDNVMDFHTGMEYSVSSAIIVSGQNPPEAFITYTLKNDVPSPFGMQPLGMSRKEWFRSLSVKACPEGFELERQPYQSSRAEMDVFFCQSREPLSSVILDLEVRGGGKKPVWDDFSDDSKAEGGYAAFFIPSPSDFVLAGDEEWNELWNRRCLLSSREPERLNGFIVIDDFGYAHEVFYRLRRYVHRQGKFTASLYYDSGYRLCKTGWIPDGIRFWDGRCRYDIPEPSLFSPFILKKGDFEKFVPNFSK